MHMTTPDNGPSASEQGIKIEASAELTLEGLRVEMMAWFQATRDLDALSVEEAQQLLQQALEIENDAEELSLIKFDDSATTQLSNSWRSNSARRILRLQTIVAANPVGEATQPTENKTETLIKSAEEIIVELEQAIQDPAFDPTQPIQKHSGQSGLDLVGRARSAFNRAVLVLSNSSEDDNRLRAEELKDDLGVRLSALERNLAIRVFEQWKAGVEPATPQLQQLRALTNQVEQSINAGTPSTALMHPLESALTSARTAMQAAVSGEAYEKYLTGTYWEPAETCLRKLGEAEVANNEKAEFGRWNTSVNQLRVAIRAIIDLRGSSVISSANYAASTTLDDQLGQEYTAVAQLIEQPSKNQLIEQPRQELLAQYQNAKRVVQERVNESGKEEWNAQTEVVGLKAIINEVNAIDISKNIAPHCGTVGPTCFDSLALAEGSVANPGFKARLAEAYEAVRKIDLLDKQKAYPRSTLVGGEVDQLISAYSGANNHLDQCIARSKEQPDVVDREWFEAKILKIEETFAKFKDTINMDEYNDMIKMRDKMASLVDRGKIARSEVDYFSAMISARKELNDVYLMIESTQDIMIETIRPNEVDLRSSQLGHLFKHKQVGEAWRLMDRIMTGNEPGLPDVDSSTLTADRDRVISYVASKTDKASAGIAYRLYRVFFRASELDKLNKAVIKDQVRELIHFTEFRDKYREKQAESGPKITLGGYFDYVNKKGTKGHAEPIIYVLAPGNRPTYDPGWDLYPGFFHHCYVGETYESSQDGVAYKRKMSTNLDSKGRIIDFTSYTNSAGELMVENMPWDQIEEDALATWYRQMKNTAHFVKSEMIKTEINVSSLTQVATYQRLTNTLTYLHPYIFGLRELMNQATLYKRKGRNEFEDSAAKAKEVVLEFQYMFLLGLIHHNFQVAELSVAVKRSQVRDILRVAVKSGFITAEHRKRINGELDKWQRLVEESLLGASERSRKELFDI